MSNWPSEIVVDYIATGQPVSRV